jgi:flagellar hook-associated protein 2
MASGISFSGLSSGLDTENIIRQLMQIERMPIQRMEVKKSHYNTEQKIWGQLNTKLKAFDTAMADLKLDATFNSKTATSSDESIITATGDSTAVNATYNIEIQQLAKTDIYASSGTFDNSLDNSGLLTITAGAETLDVSLAATDGVDTIAQKINDAVTQKRDTDSSFEGVTANVIDGRLVIESVNTGSDGALSFADDQGGLITSELDFANNQLQANQDAKVDINGILVQRSSNTITDAIAGVTLNLHKANPGSTETIEVNNNTEKSTKSVKKKG